MRTVRSYVPIAALFAAFLLLQNIGTPTAAQGQGVRIYGVDGDGRDTAIRGTGAAAAVRPLEVTALTTLSAANTTVTLTLPAAGAGLYHYLTGLTAVRTCTAAITGTAALAYTSTNLPGTLAWTAGNACAVGATHVDIPIDGLMHPLKSSAANTATTIVAPAAGATGLVRLTAYYYTAK